MDINKVILIGNLTRDPEIRTAQSGAKVAKFSIAVNRKYTVNNETKGEVSFLNCVAWGKLADIVSQYCDKGKKVAIDGRLHQNRWQDQSGNNRSAVEIIVETLQLLGSASGKPMDDKSSENLPQPEPQKTSQPDLLDEPDPF